MIPEHRMKQGDLLPPVRGQLLDGDGKAQPLTGAVVRFHMWGGRGNLLIDRAAVVVDAATGKVRYDWQAGDTDTAGIFLCEFEADFSGSKLSFPNDKNARIVIRKTRV